MPGERGVAGKAKRDAADTWERGWIDSTKVVSGTSMMRYSKDGKKKTLVRTGK
jgi:hypothetical protein